MSIPRPVNDDARVAALRRLEILDTDDESAFDRIVSLASDLYEVPMAFISFIDAERQWIKSCVGLTGRETARDDSFCGYAILSGSVMIVPDAYEDERFARNPYVTGPPEIRFYVGVPLSTPDGFTVGSLCLADRVVRPDLIETGFGSLEKLAEVIEETLELRIAHGEHLRELAERQRAEADLERSTALIGLLQKVTATANEVDSIEQALAPVLEGVCGFTGWPIGHAFLTDPGTGDLVSSSVWYATGRTTVTGFMEATSTTRLALGEGLAGDTLAAGRPSLATDISNDPHFVRADAARAAGLRSWFAFPILTGHDVAGVLEFFAEDEPLPAKDLLNVMTQIGTSLGRVVERQRSNAALSRRGEEARAARLAADEANRAKSEFLARMSHELRTPLNAILGFSQLLEMDDLAPLQISNVREIVRGGRHLLDLINEVLDISRIETGDLTLSLEPVCLPDVIDECAALVRPLADKRSIQLSVCEGASGNEHVHADRQRLKQVLLNLLSNGIKYNHDGGTVKLECSLSEANILFEVSDTGPGISQSGIDQLFVPFQRLGAENTNIEGTGLGLALTKRLVEAMGGTISVRSELGSGTTFLVELAATTAPVTTIDTGRQRSISEAQPGTSGRLLYIEDNTANLKLVERILGLRPGIEMIPAMQGELGVELARRHVPDLILLDVNLPDIDGFEVLSRLRSDPVTAAIPTIVVSADATARQIERLLARGADDYLTKPLDVKSFLSILDETLGAAA